MSLHKIKQKTECFYDIEEQISTTGYLPTRGIYIKVDLEDNTVIWLDEKSRVIPLVSWINKLNELLCLNTEQ